MATAMVTVTEEINKRALTHRFLTVGLLRVYLDKKLKESQHIVSDCDRKKGKDMDSFFSKLEIISNMTILRQSLPGSVIFLTGKQEKDFKKYKNRVIILN